MPKQDLGKMLKASAERSTPGEIRRGKGVGLSTDDVLQEEAQSATEPQIQWVHIDHLLDNPYQHAEEIDDEHYAALVESIKIDTFQGALNVSPVEAQPGYFFITSGGHMRRNAARDAGLQKLPVFVAASPTEKKQLGLRLARENTAQVNRSPVNLGFLFLQLIEQHGMTQEEIAAAIRKDRYHVNFAIMAARSAADIRAAMREKYSPRVMTYLRRLEYVEDRAPIIARYLENELTVEGVRLAVERVQAEKKRHEALPRLEETQGVLGENQTERVKLPKVERTSSRDTHGEWALLETAQGQQEEMLATLHAVHGVSQSEHARGEGSLTQQSSSVLERESKVQAVFSRLETYRRYIDRLRADGLDIHLSPHEATILEKIIDRCHTMLDTYQGH